MKTELRENIKAVRMGEAATESIILDKTIKNREANFAIAVTESQTSDPIGNYREISLGKIICALGEYGLPFEVSFKIARTRGLLDEDLVLCSILKMKLMLNE
jgi:hypothetical protein